MTLEDFVNEKQIFETNFTSQIAKAEINRNFLESAL